jgi:hypothetical protein
LCFCCLVAWYACFQSRQCCKYQLLIFRFPVSKDLSRNIKSHPNYLQIHINIKKNISYYGMNRWPSAYIEGNGLEQTIWHTNGR